MGRASNSGTALTGGGAPAQESSRKSADLDAWGLGFVHDAIARAERMGRSIPWQAMAAQMGRCEASLRAQEHTARQWGRRAAAGLPEPMPPEPSMADRTAPSPRAHVVLPVQRAAPASRLPPAPNTGGRPTTLGAWQRKALLRLSLASAGAARVLAVLMEQPPRDWTAGELAIAARGAAGPMAHNTVLTAVSGIRTSLSVRGVREGLPRFDRAGVLTYRLTDAARRLVTEIVGPA